MPIKFKLPKKPPGPVSYGLDFKDPKNRVMGLLHNNTHKAGVKPRHHLDVHMSDLDPERKWCPREPALLHLNNAARPMEFHGSLQTITHEFGHAGADIVIKLIGKHRIYGRWHCRACGNVRIGAGNHSQCHTCGARSAATEHLELKVRDPDTRVVGSIDLLADLAGNGFYTAIEIKTEGGESFKKRTAATFSHEWRTKGYLYLLDKDPDTQFLPINKQDARVLYVCKSGGEEHGDVKSWKVAGSKSPFKEYLVKRDDAALKNQLASVMTLREWVYGQDPDNGYFSKKELPPRVSGCDGPLCVRARRCPVAKTCWASSDA